MNPLNPRDLELWKVTKTYPSPNGEVAVVRDFTLNVEEGEFVAIIGHSGCGKSTVLSMLAGLTSISSGGIIVDNKEISGPGPDRGMVFQSPSLLPWLTALGNVQLAVDQVLAKTHNRRQRRDKAVEYLELVGLGDAMSKYPGELSQGMRQRVGIARAFATEPKVLLLDEPFGMLDMITRLELQQVLLDLWRTHRKTAVLVTHDVDEALFLADRVVMMTNGPEARVGGVIMIPFERPRHRATVMEDRHFDVLRNRLLGFLAEHQRLDTVEDKEAVMVDDCGEGMIESPAEVEVQSEKPRIHMPSARGEPRMMEAKKRAVPAPVETAVGD